MNMQKPSVIELFFTLIQCSLGKRKELPCVPSPEEWEKIFDIAQKQTLAGITFAAVEKLPKEQLPPKKIILQWYCIAENIKKKNIELDRKCALVSEKFKNEGFRNCILKGQGIARLYPNPLLRTPGDIDIWLEGGTEKIIGYVRKHFPKCAPTYHHIDFLATAGHEIEIHYRPTWMYNAFTNKKLQTFFTEQSNAQFTNTVNTGENSFQVPTASFNRIYILLHIYRHLFFEGIGLRQVLDYYYVMQQEMTDVEKVQYIKEIKRFGVEKFAGATMYAMQQVFAFDTSTSPVKPNKRHGEFLIKEIMLAGNFGKHDRRYIQKNGLFAKLFNNARRAFTLLLYYPKESIWAPYFKIWHYLWRKKRERTT